MSEIQRAMDDFSRLMAASTQAVTQAAEGVNSISDATEEQSQATSAIAVEIERIARMAESTSEAMAQSLAAAQSLGAMGANLSVVANRFKA